MHIPEKLIVPCGEDYSEKQIYSGVIAVHGSGELEGTLFVAAIGPDKVNGIVEEFEWPGSSREGHSISVLRPEVLIRVESIEQGTPPDLETNLFPCQSLESPCSPNYYRRAELEIYEGRVAICALVTPPQELQQIELA